MPKPYMETLSTQRYAQATNDFFLETEDLTRLEQLRAAAHNGELTKIFSALRSEPLVFANTVEYNLQRQTLMNMKTFDSLNIDMQTSPLQKLDDLLTNAKTFAVIDYVVTQAHADQISDMLLAWSQDNLLHNNQSTVVVVTSNVGLFNETLRRLSYTIEVVPSTREERQDLGAPILEEVMKAWKLKHGTKLTLKLSNEVLDESSGLTLGQFKTALIYAAAVDHEITPKRFTEAKVNLMKTIGLEWMQPQITPEMIGGYTALKKDFNDYLVLPLSDPERAKEWGIGLPRGVIVDGPPGVGKTLFAYMLATWLRLPMIKLTPADLYRGIVGESETRLRQIVRAIEAYAPMVVFVDELDQLFPIRGMQTQSDSGVSRRIQNGLLEALGNPNRKTFWFGATNLIESVDEALYRPGRFDKVLYIPYPSFEARLEIFNVQCTLHRKIPIAELDTNYLGTESLLFTGAEIEKWCLQTARHAFVKGEKPVTTDHFKATRNQIQVDRPERMRQLNRKREFLSKLPNVDIQMLNESFAELEKSSSDKTALQGLLKNL